MAWSRPNEANATPSPTASVTVASTAALAASTARRRGAAANVTRISPVLYSEVKASTPSTATAITAYSRLMTAGSSGSDGGAVFAAPVFGALAKAKATMALTATGVTTATSRAQKVERTERNLVHSDPMRSVARVARDGALMTCPPAGL